MTTATQGSAELNGRTWGSRPGGWASVEEQQLPTYEAALRRVGLAPGRRVLEVGCGTGVFLERAAHQGAEVFGLDATEPLLDIARRRVPEADLRVGDLQFLPYEDDFFDVVAGFNSFFFAADLTAALREAGRVAKPGAPVVIQVWGRPERCDVKASMAAVAQFRPPSRATGGPPLWQPGVLETLASEAGLTPDDAFDVSWAYEFGDEDALARAMLAPGPVSAAAHEHGEQPVRTAIVDALAPYRLPDGSYRLANEWHFLIARAKDA